jgi:ATP-binding protein involved in chromosome partitioning
VQVDLPPSRVPERGGHRGDDRGELAPAERLLGDPGVSSAHLGLYGHSLLCELHHCQTSYLRWHPSGPSSMRPVAFGPFSSGAGPTRVIGVSSGKGGVGKSSVTVNVAVAMAAAGHSVAILDADVYGFSVPAMLGLAGTQGLTMSDGKVQPPTAFGVRVMSMGFFANEDQPVIWRGPMLHKALEQFLGDVDWGSPDFLLVDMPPGTGDVALSMSQYLPASEVYVVTTPQVAARRVAQRSAYMARKLNLPLRGVIENMSWFSGPDGSRYEIFGTGGGAQLAEELGVPLLGQVPLVAAIREGGDSGEPIVVAEPSSEAAEAFKSVARQIVELGPGRIFREELRIK